MGTDVRQVTRQDSGSGRCRVHWTRRTCQGSTPSTRSLAKIRSPFDKRIAAGQAHGLSCLAVWSWVWAPSLRSHLPGRRRTGACGSTCNRRRPRPKRRSTRQQTRNWTGSGARSGRSRTRSRTSPKRSVRPPTPSRPRRRPSRNCDATLRLHIGTRTWKRSIPQSQGSRTGPQLGRCLGDPRPRALNRASRAIRHPRLRARRRHGRCHVRAMAAWS
jgi:hypothetical protein